MRDPSTLSDSQLASGRAWLSLQVVIMNDRGVTVEPLPNKKVVVIGRGESADVRIDNPRISRQHVRLHVNETIQVEALPSANGTVVRDAKLKDGECIQVLPGEAITLGTTIVILQPRYQPVSSFEPTAPGPAALGLPAGIVLADDQMKKVYTLATRAAGTSINLLILGETGVGKDVLAQTVHRSSPRSAKPLVGINCAALAETLLESELFGHERGAFTGAIQSKAGLLESASDGTVFLDEVGELSPSTQAKLLRVLETREVMRLGSVKPRRVNLRFVSATNKDLASESLNGSFRRDLYFRLNGLTLVVPPLRERVSEVIPLAQQFALSAWSASGRSGRPTLSSRAEARLTEYSWPGNIRELKNTVERALIHSDGATIDAEHLVFEPPAKPLVRAPSDSTPPSESQPDVRSELSELERRRIVEALDRFGGNQTRAAQHLGMPRRTLVKRLDQYGLSRPRKNVE